MSYINVLFLGKGSTYAWEQIFPNTRDLGTNKGSFIYSKSNDFSIHASVHEGFSTPVDFVSSIYISQLIIITFTYQSQQSLFDVIEKWHPVLITKNSTCSIILLGVYIGEDSEIVVKKSQGIAIAKLIDCPFYELKEDIDMSELNSYITGILTELRGQDLHIDKKKSKKITRRKKARLKLDWCQNHTNVILEEIYKEKRYNFHKIENSPLSPFAAALLHKNYEAADFFLRIEKGFADLSNLFLDQIPDALVHWKYSVIKELNISNNRLNSVPINFRHIEKVNLNGNPLLCYPLKYRKCKWIKLQEYLDSISTGNIQWNVRKVLILGEEASGKTTLTKCLKSKHSKTDIDVNLSTDGVSMSELVLKEKKSRPGYTINFWDFGGQIIYYPTHQFFLSSHSAYIIVFDYSNVKLQRLEYWFKQIKAQCCSSIIAILVGTHIDLCSNDEVAILTRKLQTTFPRQRYPFFTGEIYPVSCYSGIGIPELKVGLFKLADNSILAPKCPVKWAFLSNLVYSYTKLGIERVPWEGYWNWAKACGMDNKEDVIKCTSLLESSGVLLHLHDKTESYESSQIILSPQWLANIMACFITTKKNFVTNGILKEENLPKILADSNKYPTSLYNSITRLLQKFQIIYKYKNKYIIPSMLPSIRPGHEILSLFPSESQVTENTVGRVFEFPSMPLGFFERLEVTLFSHNGLSISIPWKRGVLMKGDNCQLLVEYNDTRYELYLRFRYKFKFSKTCLPIYTAILASISNMILAFYPGLNEMTKESILCPHCIKRGIDNESIWRFSKSDVVNKIETKSLKSLLHCNDLKGISRIVSAQTAAPDLCLTDVNIIPLKSIKIGKLIGEGGAGSVYLGEIEGTKVAIKQLHIKEKHDYTLKYSEFLSEATMMSSLDHPNIIKLYGVIETPKSMVLEFVGGGDLFELLHPEIAFINENKPPLSQKSISWTRRLGYAHDIAQALAYLQCTDPPIVHRDLRSPNIFLTEGKKSAMIGDFGLALRVTNQIGGVLNTWQWLAPEVIASDSSGYDEKSDIFSLGVIFWELASLEMPYEEYKSVPDYYKESLDEWNIQNIKSAIIEDELRPTIPEKCPDYFKTIIEKCWLHNPKERITAVEICSILETRHSFCVKATNRQSLNIRFNDPIKRTLVRSRAVTISKQIKAQQTISIQGNITCIIPVSSCMFVGTREGRIFIISILEPEGNAKLIIHEKLQNNSSPIMFLIFTGVSVWSCGRDGKITVWDPQEDGKFAAKYSWNPLDSIKILPSCIASVISIDVESVWIGSGSEGKITIWDSINYNCISTITSEYLLGCNFILDYKTFVLVASRGGKIVIIDKKNRCILGLFSAHDTTITSMVIVRNENSFWTASNTGEIAMWKMTCVEDIQRIGCSTLHQSKILSLFYVRRFSQIFSLSFDGAFFRWDIQKKIATEEISENLKLPVALSGTTEGHLWTTTTDSVQLWPLTWSGYN